MADAADAAVPRRRRRPSAGRVHAGLHRHAWSRMGDTERPGRSPSPPSNSWSSLAAWAPSSSRCCRRPPVGSIHQRDNRRGRWGVEALKRSRSPRRWRHRTRHVSAGLPRRRHDPWPIRPASTTYDKLWRSPMNRDSGERDVLIRNNVRRTRSRRSKAPARGSKYGVTRSSSPAAAAARESVSARLTGRGRVPDAAGPLGRSPLPGGRPPTARRRRQRLHLAGVPQRVRAADRIGPRPHGPGDDGGHSRGLRPHI